MKNWICVAATSLLALGSAHAAAETTASGLVYEAITVGTGAQPAPTDTVRVIKQAGMTQGVEFRPSRERELLARAEPLTIEEQLLVLHMWELQDCERGVNAGGFKIHAITFHFALKIGDLADQHFHPLQVGGIAPRHIAYP